MRKDLDYYRSLPYPLKVERFEEEEDGAMYYRAFYEDLPDVEGVHKDRMKAVQLAKELFDSFVEAQLQWGEDIPEPASPRSRKVGGLWTFKASGAVTTASSGDRPSSPDASDTTAGIQTTRPALAV